MKNKQIKVLLIEDDKGDQIAFENMIKNKQLPYHYKIAESIAEAKELITSELFDIVIADYILSDGTAFELFDIISQPTIFVTGKGDETVAVRALKAGVYDYLIKDELYHYLEEIPAIIEKAHEIKTIKILLIEDDEGDQVAFEDLVKDKQLPYIYKIAGSIADAKALLTSEHFDIVVTDYLLGDGTTFELFDIINQPIIFVTGKGDEIVAVKAMKAGVYDYIIKDTYYQYLQNLPLIIEGAYSHSVISQKTKIRSPLVSTEELVDLSDLTKELDVFCAKFSDVGTIPLQHTSMEAFGSSEDAEAFITYQAMFYQVAVGHGDQPAQGLFGPFPVRGHPNRLSYIYSFTCYDSTLTDPRLSIHTHAIIVIIFHEYLEIYFPPRKTIEALILPILQKVKDFSKLPDDFVNQIQEAIISLLRLNFLGS